MLLQYLQTAMRKAHYELLPDNEGFYGSIQGFQGVWANETTLEATRDELASALEDWVLFRIAKNLTLPEVDGIILTVKDISRAAV